MSDRGTSGGADTSSVVARVAEGQRGTLYRAIVGLLRGATWAFFRRVEVIGLDNLPVDRCGLLVSWHPNGLVDPGLILTRFPRRVVFGARHGLFGVPGLGFVLRRLGTVPIYRAVDARPAIGAAPSADAPDAARRAANRRSLDALAQAIADGSFAALFPEGVSHDAPHLAELKTGAARLYYRARALRGDRAPPVIIPVGLHYDRKQMFRSNALVAFHPPLELPAELDVTPRDDDADVVESERARKLTAVIETTLREVVHATDDWALHDLMQRTRRLVRAERASRVDADPGRTTIGERVLGFARVRQGYYELLERETEKVHELRARVAAYDRDLRALALEDYDLDRAPPLLPPWLAVLLVAQAIAVFLLLPPLIVLGYVVNLPTALLLRGFAALGAKLEKDEATIKLLAGLVLFPATWVGAGFLAAALHEQLHAIYPSIPDRPMLAGALTGVLAGVGGAFAVRYFRVASELARSVRVRLTRRARWVAVARLRVERAKLCDAVTGMAQDIDLPGEVAPDGRVRPRA
ncbi:MAG: 1-acyl-sn-glycerol-3-phosphate acyltransferase [Myxococcales bacterium]|nr:1-acyl-sn-glycerol-3-phosphate acyltransferase [Myxococcales bacterium]